MSLGVSLIHDNHKTQYKIIVSVVFDKNKQYDGMEESKEKGKQVVGIRYES